MDGTEGGGWAMSGAVVVIVTTGDVEEPEKLMVIAGSDVAAEATGGGIG